MRKLSYLDVKGRVSAYRAAIRSLQLEIDDPLDSDLYEDVCQKKYLRDRLEREMRMFATKHDFI